MKWHTKHSINGAYIAYALIIVGFVIHMALTEPLALLFIVIGVVFFVAIMALGMYLTAKGLGNKYDNFEKRH